MRLNSWRLNSNVSAALSGLIVPVSGSTSLTPKYVDIACLAVDLVHLGHLGSPLDFILLIDTYGVNPQRNLIAEIGRAQLNKCCMEVRSNPELLLYDVRH